ncbi:hypothetical protein HAX54_036279 [Datura stramonium]|uniref:Uncharacterized protein n=1 Tax=Datura stramonium TaxID=4076 RepID=A0ABS8RNS8_DATST|nr:hypothetical protein [Datura stramonium]
MEQNGTIASVTWVSFILADIKIFSEGPHLVHVAEHIWHIKLHDTELGFPELLNSSAPPRQFRVTEQFICYELRVTELVIHYRDRHSSWRFAAADSEESRQNRHGETLVTIAGPLQWTTRGRMPV